MTPLINSDAYAQLADSKRRKNTNVFHKLIRVVLTTINKIYVVVTR